MAVLPDNVRFSTWAKWMRDNTSPISVNKPDLRAAINAIDQWVDDNQSSFNTALPLPARTELTASQKASLLAIVVLARYTEGV